MKASSYPCHHQVLCAHGSVTVHSETWKQNWFGESMDTKPTLRMAGSGASEGLCAKARIKRSDLPEAQEKFGIIFSLHFLRTFGIHLKFMVDCAIYICIHHLIAFNNE